MKLKETVYFYNVNPDVQFQLRIYQGSMFIRFYKVIGEKSHLQCIKKAVDNNGDFSLNSFPEFRRYAPLELQVSYRI